MFVDTVWRPPDGEAYSYLLGLYLGDGHLATYPRTMRLIITCDAAYPRLIQACAASMASVGLARKVRIQPDAKRRCVRVSGFSKRWPEVFPQHGPGRKHNRKIELEPWQRDIVDQSRRSSCAGFCTRTGAEP